MRYIKTFNSFLNEIRITAIEDWTKDDYEKFNDLKLKNLVDTCKLCDKYNIRYYLDGGTLLGLYRDKQMINGDSDNDVAIMAEDITPEFLEAIKDYCVSPEAKGNFFQPNEFPDFEDKEAYLKPLSLKYHSLDGEGKRLKFKDKMIWTDLFTLYPHKDYHLFMLGVKYFRIPNKFLGKKGSLTYKGVSFNIPLDVEDYLELVYGKEWKTPDPNYMSSNDNKGFYVVEQEKFGNYTFNWDNKKGRIDK
jgi:hypothetical protein